jgi:hypothetical protein
MKHELFANMVVSPLCHETGGFSADARLAYFDCPPNFHSQQTSLDAVLPHRQSEQGFIADYPILC